MNSMSTLGELARRTLALASCTLVVSTALHAQATPVETIGPWALKAAPMWASLISGGGVYWHSLNIVNTPIGEHTAFTGLGVADDGFANADINTIIEVVFAAGVVSNLPGSDLVMFDSLFSVNSYAVSTDYDAFTAELALPSTAFTWTGVMNQYYHQGQLYGALVLAAPIDLSSLGVPAGASITRVRFRTTSTEADPLGIGALCHLCAQPFAYGTTGTTSNGCLATISYTGTPSASASSGFSIVVSNVEGQKHGLVFYGTSGQAASPWGTGTSFLCVKAPIQPTAVQLSGGTFALCDGALSLDWNQYIATHASALGNPFTPGIVVDAQGWFRDPGAAKSTSLSNALEFVVQP